MSFQAYIQNIIAKTKLSPISIQEEGVKKGVLVPGIKANEFIAWLNKDYKLGRGHSMALWKLFIENHWITPNKGSSILKPKGKLITIKVVINKPVNVVWTCWKKAQHIVHWHFASDEWHTPKAKNTLKKGGQFSYRMASKDGKEGFDFKGQHLDIKPLIRISSRLDDGRSLVVDFKEIIQGTEVTETFQAETTNSITLQRQGWQSILHQFKRYCEAK